MSMADDCATVSVVIPCYKYGHFLPDCVRSVLTQEGVDVRVLVIDDASPDDSGQVALGLAAEDERVEVRIHEVNRGHIATYNEGLLEWADGKYSVLISADDVMAPGALARATAVMDANPNVGFVYGHAAWWREGQPRPFLRVNPSGAMIWPGQEWLRIMCRGGHNVISSPEVVVRTSLQQKLGGYRPDLPQTADAEMWMRFAVHSDVAYVKGADQALYRIHSNNMSRARGAYVDLVERKAAFDALFAAHGDQIPAAARLHRRADRSMAKEALWRACRAYERRRLDTTPVAELVEFAELTYPHTAQLPEYWGLRWRQRIGPRVCPYLQPLMVSAVHRRVRTKLWWRRWVREGV